MINRKKVVCYLSAAAGDWGGASRVLFTNIRLLNRDRFEPLLLLPADGPITPSLREWGVRYVLWGNQHEPNGVLRYLVDVLRAARFFRLNRVDILHINHANYWRPAEMIAARLLRIPVITHYHVVNTDPGPFVKHSTLIVAVSHYTAEQSLPRNTPKAIVHNAVDTSRFDAAKDIRAECGLPADCVVVSFVGQIRRLKGIDLFIELTRRIPGEKVRFLIVGECRDPAKFEGSYTEPQLRSEISADKRVLYLGYRSDVQNVYRSSDILVMPSRWGEPFGLINIEAGAARRPMVSTRDGGIPEIITHGDNGFLVDREDLDGLVRYTRTLIDSESLRLRMGHRAREIVEQNFTHAPIRKLESVYEELTRTRRAEAVGPTRTADAR